MTTPGIPPMEPLASIVDEMRAVADEEIPAPRTCHVKLYDDGTFYAVIFHSGAGEREQISYERTIGEILWEYYEDTREMRKPLSGGEEIITSEHEEIEVRTITTVEPPDTMS